MKHSAGFSLKFSSIFLTICAQACNQCAASRFCGSYAGLTKDGTYIVCPFTRVLVKCCRVDSIILWLSEKDGKKFYANPVTYDISPGLVFQDISIHSPKANGRTLRFSGPSSRDDG